MTDVVVYPSIITTDKDKLFACYALIHQAIAEHNKMGALSKGNPEKYRNKFRAYQKQEFEPRLAKLLLERDQLKETIRKANYTDKQWGQVSKLSIEEQIAVDEALYGNKIEEKVKPTLASSYLLDELKAIDLDKLDTLEGIDPVEDPSAYTEYPSETEYLSQTSTRSTFTALDRDVTVYLYYDKGVDHFDGDFEHLATVVASAADAGASVNSWALGNMLGDRQQVIDANEDLLASFLYSADGSNYRINIHQILAGTPTADWSGDITLGSVRYIKIKRDEAVGANGTIYNYIYTDASRETLEDTLSVTLGEKEDFRYIYLAQSNNTGDSGYNLTGYIENVDTQEGWANISKVSGVTATDLAKVDGIAVADIAKINGVAV